MTSPAATPPTDQYGRQLCDHGWLIAASQDCPGCTTKRAARRAEDRARRESHREAKRTAHAEGRLYIPELITHGTVKSAETVGCECGECVAVRTARKAARKAGQSMRGEIAARRAYRGRTPKET